MSYGFSDDDIADPVYGAVIRIQSRLDFLISIARYTSLFFAFFGAIASSLLLGWLASLSPFA